MLLVLTGSTVFAAEVDPAQLNADKFGFLTLLPPLIAIVLAFITKKCCIIIIFRGFSGTFLLQLQGKNIFGAILNGFLDIINKVLGSLSRSLECRYNTSMYDYRSLIALVSKMGGAKSSCRKLS